MAQTNTEGRGLRQQPGFACEECRRRKARCDRGRPKCSFCTERGMTCSIVDKRQQRGPKKGQLNAMRSQIATLQWQLDQHLGSNSNPTSEHTTPRKLTPERGFDDSNSRADTIIVDDDYSNRIHTNSLDETNPGFADFSATTPPTTAASIATTATTTTASPAMSSTFIDSEPANPDIVSWADCIEWHDLENGLMPSYEMTESAFIDHLNRVEMMSPSSVATDNLKFKLNDLVRTDLDQLYFDRVYPVCPIVHRRRYFSWANQEHQTPAQTCLQSAMRTMAAAMSAQLSHLVDNLCAETSHLLETHCSAIPKDQIPIEYIQAWLLLAYAELLRVGEHQAMLTAGRAFRLLQMGRLYDVDAAPDDSREGSPTIHTTENDLDESFVDAEEKRRTFWLAFSLDRFLCMRSEWPLTLHEEMVRTRLPAPEANFQNNRRIRVGFLPEAMAAQNGGASPSITTALSPFAECVVMAAIYGRCMTHRRTYAKGDPASSRPTSPGAGVVAAGEYDFWAHQEWLASAVEKRIQILAARSAAFGDPGAAGDGDDPLLLFTHILANSAVVFLSNVVAKTGSWRTMEQQLVTAAYERRASAAALEMVRLARAVLSLSCFKAHPFLPDPLTCAASFLSTTVSGAVVGGDDSVEQLLRVLRDIRGVNSLAREVLESLESRQ